MYLPNSKSVKKSKKRYWSYTPALHAQLDHWCISKGFQGSFINKVHSILKAWPNRRKKQNYKCHSINQTQFFPCCYSVTLWPLQITFFSGLRANELLFWNKPPTIMFKEHFPLLYYLKHKYSDYVCKLMGRVLFFYS